MAHLKVIARYRDGRKVKGTTDNFAPDSEVFHMMSSRAKPGERPVAVSVGDLKAIFVVRDFAGDPSRPERRYLRPGTQAYGQKLRVTFKDGEVLEGVSLTYDREVQGFFLCPADPNSNNERIFVVNAAVAEVRRL